VDYTHFPTLLKVGYWDFFRFLDIVYSKWEIGQKRPTGTALELLHLVQKNGLEIVA